MGDTKGMGDLNYIQVNHPHESLRNGFSKRSKVCHLDPIIHVVVSFTIFCKLKVEELIFEDFISIDDMLGFGRYIYPLINDLDNLFVGWVLCATVILDLKGVDNLEDELCIDVGAYMI